MRLHGKKKSASKRSVIDIWASICRASFIVFFLIFFTGTEVYAQDECGPCSECPDPLVELKPMRIGGDTPEHFKNYAGNFATNYWHGWAWYFLKKHHPCADLYYILEQPDGSTSRHGVDEGEAKYVIESYAIIEVGNGKVPVWRLSGWDGSDYASLEPALVPRLGRIEVHHDLIALKNGETYDFSVDILDWIPEPPEDEFYGSLWGDKVVIDGVPYVGDDGIFCGEWGPSDVAGGPITFEKGDIGITIRKKETPATASLSIDYDSVYPDYRLELTGITNRFGETLPDNVVIVLKADKGYVDSGISIGEYLAQQGYFTPGDISEELWDLIMSDWNVFTTSGGRISEPVLYSPPPCIESKTDTLQIAGLCDFHDGMPSICESEIVEKSIDVLCYDLTLRMEQEFVCTGECDWREEGTTILASTYRRIRFVYWAEFDHEYTFGDSDDIRECYGCKSSRFSFAYDARGDSYEERCTPDCSSTSWSTILRALDPKLRYSCLDPTLFLDPNSKKAVGVFQDLLFGNCLDYTVTCVGSCSQPAGEPDWYCFYPRMDSEGQSPPIFSAAVTFGDGISYFGGGCERSYQGDDCIGYPTLAGEYQCAKLGRLSCQEKLRWEMTRRPSTARKRSRSADLNWDGDVDFEDLTKLADFWLQAESGMHVTALSFANNAAHVAALHASEEVEDVTALASGGELVDLEDFALLGEHWRTLPGTVAYWKLDEAEGTVAHDSVGGNDATLHGDPIWQPAGGKIGGALQFDGTGDYASTDFLLDPGDGPLSVFCWIKDGAPGEVVISQQAGEIWPGVTWLRTEPLDGRLMTEIMHPQPALVSDFVVADGNWHEIGLVWDGSRRYLYVDHQEVAQDALDMGGTFCDGGLYFGAGADLDAARFFSGLIDDIHVYDRVIKP